jgi:heat shock protein HtpX
MNNLKTGLLLIGLTALLVWLGSLIGGGRGAQLAFVIALAMNVGAYWFSDKLVLRMYRARPVTEAEAPVLYGLVADLAQRAQIPMPAVYVIPDPGLNAFATGRSPRHAAVAVTDGLLRSLDRSELAGVLAHELSHVKHRDILIGTVAATLVGAVTWISNMAQWSAMFGGLHSSDEEGGGGNPFVTLIVAMVAAVAATLLQLAVSRSREYEADAGAARMLGDAYPLISALRKLDYAAERLPVNAGPASAHLFIVNPLRGGSFVARWLSTHPDIKDRIRALEALGGGQYSRA